MSSSSKAFASVAVGAATNLILSRINRTEREKLDALRNLCMSILKLSEENMPQEFMLDKDGIPTYHVNRESFNLTYWENLFIESDYRKDVASMIGTICQYQTEYTKSFLKNKQQYTFVLLGEFLKRWLKDKFGSNQHPSELLANVTNLSEFLRRLETDSLFNDQKLLRMILEFRLAIERVYIPQLQLDAERASAETDLNLLRNYVQTLLDYCVRYLYYTLRNTEITNHNEINLVSLLKKANNQTVDIKADPVFKLPSGFLLKALLMSFSKTSTNNIFGTATSRIAIPSELLLSQESKVVVTLQKNPVKYFEVFKDGSDLIPDLCQPKILENYLLLFKLVFELAKYEGYFNAAVELAKRGGDILVYGFANGQGHLTYLFLLFSQLLLKIEDTVTSLDKCIDDYYLAMVRGKKENLIFKDEVDKPWALNRKYSLIWRTHIVNKITACHTHLRDVQRTITCKTLEERLKEAERITNQFLDETVSRTHELALALELPIPPSIKDAISLRLAPPTTKLLQDNAPSSSESSQQTKERQCLYYAKKSTPKLTDADINKLDIAHAYEIDLSRQNEVTSAGFTQLMTRITQEAPSLRKLVLHNMKLGNEGAAALASALAKLPCLNFLDINECGIEANGIAIFAKHLIDSENNSLEELNVSYNTLGEEGVVALVDSLLKHPKLHSLSVQKIGITPQAANALRKLAWYKVNINTIKVDEENDQKLLEWLKKELSGLTHENAIAKANSTYLARGEYQEALFKSPSKGKKFGIF